MPFLFNITQLLLLPDKKQSYLSLPENVQLFAFNFETVKN